VGGGRFWAEAAAFLRATGIYALTALELGNRPCQAAAGRAYRGPGGVAAGAPNGTVVAPVGSTPASCWARAISGAVS
jgi:hypothetical protein